MNNILGRTLLLALLALDVPLSAASPAIPVGGDAPAKTGSGTPPVAAREGTPSALAAAAASPEHLVGGTVTTPAPNLRGGTVMATDGTDFFVVWSDGRSAHEAAVIGTRVTRNGRVLDPLGIRIASVLGAATPLHVVWDGGAYLVVWTAGSYRDGVFLSDYSVYAARIDRDGRLLMQPRVVAESATTVRGDAVASNGNVTVISYFGYQYPGTVRVAALDREGRTLHHESLPITGTSHLSMAATPARFVLTWSTRRGLHGQYVIEALALTGEGHRDGAPVQIGFGADPVIGTNGTQFLIVSLVWDERSRILQSQALDAGLARLGGVQALTSGYELDRASILWRDGRYEVVAARRDHPFRAWETASIEVEPDGEPVAVRTRGQAIPLAWAATSLVAATNGTDVLLAFSAETPGSTGLQVFARLYRGSSPVTAVQELLSWSGNAHTGPVIVAGAHGHLAAWNEQSGVYATRIDGHGRSLDGRGLQIAGKGAHGVRVAFDGTNYVVAWIEPQAVGVRRIAPATGATVAEVRVPASVWQGMDVAASAEATYIAYVQQRIEVTRIPHATNTPELPLAVSPEQMTVAAPALAWNGSTLLVAWNEIFYPRGDPPLPLAVKTLAARVTGSLSLLDPAPLVIAAAGEENWPSLGLPSVASNGDGWLVVTDLDARDVLARRVRRDGMLEGNGPDRMAGGMNAVVTWDGTRYAVAWNEGTNVWLASVPAAGALAATRRTLVAANAAPSAVSIAPAANGEAAVAYTKISFRPEHTGVERTFLRFVDYGTPRGRVIRR